MELVANIISLFKKDNKLEAKHGEKVMQKRLGTEQKALAFYDKQVLDYLNNDMMAFIKKQENAFISTSDANGHCDSSYRGGEAGFIKIIDKKNVIYPEYIGNGVQASLGNMYENPHVAILLIDFYKHQIGLHLNGRVEILGKDEVDIEDGEQKKIKCWVKVEIEEAYIHCSKRIPHLEKVRENNENKAFGNFFKTLGK
ncbi:pyridoxamine 5'-phosphate oxidase family protein [Aquibacillus sediminis]|uniref:pyridoxamine 5'-phosphate oxidase family protein n=1 Tax=Aquibacillus sediminis TaxID=2574734 RepID=UPI001FE45320|nr:pyridoxamine 5'-phosphate oxidase family protein [Aquibacillus sediminis]